MSDDAQIDADPTAQRLWSLLADWGSPPEELLGNIPRGGAMLTYLGHADTTRALIECDPFWTWEPMATDEHGAPLVERNDKGQPVGLWIRLTVCGVTRPEYGSCEPGKHDAIKELVGDAIRRGAMRFGVALSLWSKSDWSEPTLDADHIRGLIDAAAESGLTNEEASIVMREVTGAKVSRDVPLAKYEEVVQAFLNEGRAKAVRNAEALGGTPEE